MLHIILTILKIIGIILAVVLGILLTVILVVLFVPVGYSAQMDNRKDIMVKANGWWLFHALHISFFMEGMPSEENGNSPVIKVRILGIPIIDTSRKKEEKQPEAKKDSEIKPEKEPELTVQELSVKDVKGEKEIKEVKEVKEIAAVEPAAEKKPVVKKQPEQQSTAKPKIRKRVRFTDKVKDFINNIRKSINNIADTKQKIQEKIELIKRFFENEENIQGIKKIFNSIKRILKHLLPNKIRGQVQFGLNDPCATGQALGVLAVFYPYYGKSLTIEPDFTRQVLKGEIYLKGYIQIFTLCVIGIKLLIDANFKKLIKNFKKLKEEI